MRYYREPVQYRCGTSRCGIPVRVSKCRLTAKTQKEKQKVASASKNSTIVLRNARALPVRVCSPTADENMEPQADFTIVPYSKAKAAIWKHFGVRKRKADGSIVENVAICLTCQSAIKTGGSGTSNLTNHIKRHHPHLLSTLAHLRPEHQKQANQHHPNSVNKFLLVHSKL